MNPHHVMASQNNHLEIPRTEHPHTAHALGSNVWPLHGSTGADAVQEVCREADGTAVADRLRLCRD